MSYDFEDSYDYDNSLSLDTVLQHFDYQGQYDIFLYSLSYRTPRLRNEALQFYNKSEYQNWDHYKRSYKHRLVLRYWKRYNHLVMPRRVTKTKTMHGVPFYTKRNGTNTWINQSMMGTNPCRFHPQATCWTKWKKK